MSSLTRLYRAYRLYRYAAADGRTPMVAKVLPWAALLYLVSPIDFIPDFLPFVGQIDDILLVPLLVLAALGLIPKDVKRDARKKYPGAIDVEPTRP
jgi:uncharacterized membrane protein YkvA (DUF1232 family)